jgi:hypothetical protein
MFFGKWQSKPAIFEFSKPVVFDFSQKRSRDGTRAVPAGNVVETVFMPNTQPHQCAAGSWQIIRFDPPPVLLLIELRRSDDECPYYTDVGNPKVYKLNWQSDDRVTLRTSPLLLWLFGIWIGEKIELKRLN